jgi:uncharacterized membrane-anchored protein YhcB (DUF1043 family)
MAPSRTRAGLEAALSMPADNASLCIPGRRQIEGNTMQDNVMQVHVQPFFKLAQSNMDLLTRFSTSPEVTAQATADASNLLQQATESATSLMRSGAFANLMQGMWKNYTDFLTEFSRSSVTLMTQGQETLMRQAQEVTAGVVDATEARARRSRQAA